MGSSISKIYDDIETYQALCEKYNQEYKESNLYSHHYDWIRKVNWGETTESFDEYKAKKDKNSREWKIHSLKEEIVKKQEELKILEDEHNRY